MTLVGASNELPESEELDALYDRFLLRKEVKQVTAGGEGQQEPGQSVTPLAKHSVTPSVTHQSCQQPRWEQQVAHGLFPHTIQQNQWARGVTVQDRVLRWSCVRCDVPCCAVL